MRDDCDKYEPLMPLAEIPQGCSSIFPTLAASG
jgi:hypothetical protein